MNNDRNDRPTIRPGPNASMPPQFTTESGTGERSAVILHSGSLGLRTPLAAPANVLLADHLFRHPARALEPRLSAGFFRAPRSSTSPTNSSARPAPAPSWSGQHSARGRYEATGAESSADAERIPIGTIIDKYRLEELVGAGAFGMVFRATHLLLQTTVALKLLRRNVLRERPDLAWRLCEEARHAARIQHTNVVRVIDVTHTKEITYFVMEYLAGETLQRRVDDRGTLGASELARLTLDLALGLRAGLDHGVLHRDVKPANVILTTSGSAKIVDLGLAAETSTRPGTGSRPVERAGTRGYMSPEVLARGNGDFRSDMYSLGATLYFAVFGHPPGSSLRRSEFDARVPPRLAELVTRLLSSDPHLRPESYDAVIDAAQLGA